MTSECKATPIITEHDIKVTNPFVPPGRYRDGIELMLEILFRFLDKKERDDVLYNKLMLEKPDADESKYIQAACELTICAWFAYVAIKIHEKFEYEFMVNSPKDVDCAIWDKGNQFNIEVKCASYKKQNDIVATSDLVIHGLGRLSDYNSAVSKLQNVFATLPEPTLLVAAHHMDCKMKDYLIGAQEKFGKSIVSNHLNILFVCVDDQMDMTKWISYLNGPEGLFTEESFEPRESYGNVDMVVFTNLYHRHHRVEGKSNISEYWDATKAFNFAIKNPLSTKTGELFSSFANKIPLDNYDFQEYLKQAYIPEEAIPGLALSYFVADQINKGICKFQGYSGDQK